MLQPEACYTDTTTTSHTETPTHIETRTHNQCGDKIEKSQVLDDGCINVRNMLITEEVIYTLINCDIKLVSYSLIIQSTLRTDPNLCKNVSLQCYKVPTVIHIQSACSQIVHVYIYTYILHNIETLVG